MSGSRTKRVLLDPRDVDTTLHRLQAIYDLAPADLLPLRKVIGLLPRAAHMNYDEDLASQYAYLAMADKFTFDIETDELILFGRDVDTLIDAIVEMAMYLSGFTTKLGNPEAWVIEFAIGAWRTVKRRIKRQHDLPTFDQTIGILGLPSSSGEPVSDTEQLFRQLVSDFDQVSFHQMIVLAAHDNILIQFPPETHPKVRACYLHARRAMQEVGQGLGLGDHQIFNRLLNDAIQRIEQLFNPASLEPPSWLQSGERLSLPTNTAPSESPSQNNPSRATSANPNLFDAFLEQLLGDEDDDEDSAPVE